MVLTFVTQIFKGKGQQEIVSFIFCLLPACFVVPLAPLHSDVCASLQRSQSSARVRPPGFVLGILLIQQFGGDPSKLRMPVSTSSRVNLQICLTIGPTCSQLQIGLHVHLPTSFHSD